MIVSLGYQSLTVTPLKKKKEKEKPKTKLASFAEMPLFERLWCVTLFYIYNICWTGTDTILMKCKHWLLLLALKQRDQPCAL